MQGEINEATLEQVIAAFAQGAATRRHATTATRRLRTPLEAMAKPRSPSTLSALYIAKDMFYVMGGRTVYIGVEVSIFVDAEEKSMRVRKNAQDGTLD